MNDPGLEPWAFRVLSERAMLTSGLKPTDNDRKTVTAPTAKPQLLLLEYISQITAVKA